MADVRLDGALAEVEAPGDAGVGQAFGFQFEHFGLAVGQLVERVAGAEGGDEAADDVRVERRSAVGDAFGCGEELADERAAGAPVGSAQIVAFVFVGTLSETRFPWCARRGAARTPSRSARGVPA